MNIMAEIFGYILGDGWIDINGTCGAGGDAISLKNLADDTNLIFGKNTAKDIHSRRTFSEKYNISGISGQLRFSASFSRYLQKLGMPIGKRPEQAYLLPEWITNGDLDTKARFLSGYYAAEGSIPALQSNKKTPRALSFCFFKNAELEDNATKLCRQFCQLINDLGFSSNIAKTYRTTNTFKVVHTITMGNSEVDFLKELRALTLSYCMTKEIRRKQLIVYFDLKQRERKKIEAVRNYIIQLKNEKYSHKEISELTGLSIRQVEKMLSGRNKCQQVRGFPEFNQQFINTYCSTKTPLIDENLSDITRQTTTSQALVLSRVEHND